MSLEMSGEEMPGAAQRAEGPSARPPAAEPERDSGGVSAAEGFLKAKDGLELRWCSHTPSAPGQARCEIALVHGYGEHLGRYDHVAAELNCRGYAVHRFEYRGHGLSGGRRAHVDRFGDYLDDLDVFLDHLARRTARPIAIVAHSLGGLISARWLQTRAANAIDRAVLCSPFIGLAFQPPAWQRAFSRLGSRLAPSLSVGSGLTVAQLTTDEGKQRETAADPLYLHTTTPRWFCEVSAAQEALLGDAGCLATPVLMLLGSDDPIASPDAARRFFEALRCPNKSLLTFDGMRHELFNERERTRVFAALFDWLARPLEACGPADG